MIRYFITLVLIASNLIVVSQITNPYKGSYKPIYVNDSLKCWSVPQSAGILFLMVERNKFKVAFTLTDSLYNDEVRKYQKLKLIDSAKTYEIILLDSANRELKEVNLNLNHKNQQLKKVTLVSVTVAIITSIFYFLK